MSPSPVLTSALAVSVIGFSIAALRADGTVAEWSNGGSDPGISNLVTMTSGWSHGLGFRADGSITGWGDNSAGEITGYPVDLTNAIALAAGAYASLAVRADGTVVGWGDSTHNLLNVPEGLSNLTTIVSGTFSDHAFALRADGTVQEWGGDATNTHPVLTNVVAVACANVAQKVVLHFYGSVTAWPGNPPDGVTNIITVTGGGAHLLALRNDGTAFAWGCVCHGATTLPEDLTNVTAIAAGGSDGYDLSAFLIGGTNPILRLNVSQSNGALLLELVGEKFCRYVLEESTDLSSSPEWGFNRNITLSSTAKTGVELPMIGAARYYRARLMP